MFNALRYTKRLEEVGFTKQQAETALEIGIEVMNDNLSSKEDLKELGLVLKGELREEMNELSSDLRQEMNELSSTLRQEMNELSSTLRQEMNELSSTLRQEMSELKIEIKEEMHGFQDRLTLRMGAMFAATIAILGSLKFL